MSTAISGQRGTAIAWATTVTQPDGSAYDLTAAGVTTTLTVKRSRSDETPLITKTYQGGIGGDDGITIVGTDEVSIILQPGDTTARVDGSFTSTEFLVWDIIVTEANGLPVVVGSGALTVRAGVGS